MNKKTFITVALLSMGCCTFTARAQNLDKAAESYRQFNSLRAAGTDEPGIYAALYQCYKDYVEVLSAATANTPAYSQAKDALREIWPFLQTGAAYNSNHGSQQNALLFAQAYMDIPLLDAFKGEHFVRDDYFATMAYFAASGSFNAGQYDKAISYFRVYLNTGEQKNRQMVYSYMAKACMNIQNYDLAMNVLNEATDQYPQDFKMLSMAINSCLEREDNVNLQRFLTKALALRPNDEQLLNNQGLLYENTQEYQKALNIYRKLQQTRPNSLTVYKHVALNYYNLGVTFYNKASMESSGGTAKKYMRQAKEYFSAAASTLKDVVANDPTAIAYMQALALAYSCMGEQTLLEETNNKLSSIGAATVDMNTVPTILTYNGGRQAQFGPVTVQNQNLGGDIFNNKSYSSDETPLYSVYAKEYVETRIRRWQSKDPYETVDEYQARVTEETRNAKIKELLKAAEVDYIKTYTQRIRFNDMLLKPYDAENRVFLVESKYGELIVPVPRENNEAKVFESSWSGMQFKDPKFYINNDKLMLSSLTFVTPTGQSYRYNGDEGLNYVETVVDMSFEPINGNLIAQNVESLTDSRVRKKEVKVGTPVSDVDRNIPETKSVNEKTFAVIISNENYSMVSQVPMALNDGEVFRQYCKKTLGLPENNVRLYQNASFGVMIRAMRDIKDIAAAYNGDIQVIFYYAGHGIPNEATKDAFLLPIDADGTQTEGCYSLNRLYSELGGLNARSVVVFLDACFSGANRDGGMLASARGVALKAKKEAPQGNMVIFSAASDDETAFPYKEKGHGLFTYFLLKKLQETKGNVSLQELGDYITRNVKRQSVVVNRKMQTPTVTVSSSLATDWQDIRLKP